jgi:hypothetical protein
MIKSEVTLLLTIYNRRTFTLRWIQFIKDFNCSFNIYICGGGNDKLIERKLKNLAKNINLYSKTYDVRSLSKKTQFFLKI